MSHEMDAEQGLLLPMTAGEKLRHAREAAGKTAEQIAEQTRVPLRAIRALETDAYTDLPSGPYATGFARSVARAVGVDADEIVEQVRAGRAEATAGVTAAREEFEPIADSRIPGRALAWTTALIALAMVLGYLGWRYWYMAPPAADAPAEVVRADAPPAANAATTPAATAPPTPVAVPPGFAAAPLRIAASERVWFSLTDAAGNSQFDLTLEGGEFYTVKPEQRTLFLRTGRPQSLTLLVGEQRLPPLGAPDEIVSNVGLDAASLARRAAGLTPPAAAPATRPATPPAGAIR